METNFHFKPVQWIETLQEFSNMFSAKEKEDLLKKIHDSVVEFEEEVTADLCRQAVDSGIDAHDAIIGGLAEGMVTVGAMYERNEYFVPELLLCSDALYAGLDILRPHVRAGTEQVRGKIMIGVVEGDIHDIGKSLVKTMFEAAGWKVFDLGKDVKTDRFVSGVTQHDPDVIALSALMTTSMLAMPKIIEAVKAEKPGVIVMVGGAPLNHDIARRYGADSYADDAVSAVHEAARLFSNSVPD